MVNIVGVMVLKSSRATFYSAFYPLTYYPTLFFWKKIFVSRGKE